MSCQWVIVPHKKDLCMYFDGGLITVKVKPFHLPQECTARMCRHKLEWRTYRNGLGEGETSPSIHTHPCKKKKRFTLPILYMLVLGWQKTSRPYLGEEEEAIQPAVRTHRQAKDQVSTNVRSRLHHQAGPVSATTLHASQKDNKSTLFRYFFEVHN